VRPFATGAERVSCAERLRASALWAGLAVGAFAPAARALQQESVFDRARQLAEQGDPLAALDLARGETDPVQRARAEVWIYYRARDFDSALAAAELGLASDPQDLWLLEREGACALSLRDGELAREASARFSGQLASAPPAERETWAAAARELEQQSAALLEQDARAERAGRLARWTALALIAASIGLCVWLARPVRRAH
jgi:hypothetical protein